jgi:hypothetical protein
MEPSMKKIDLFIFTVIFTLAIFFRVNAQSAEKVWLSTNTAAYKTGETVVVTVNAVSESPVQGFTFQIRYDPACLKLVSATSPISGMNGLLLPATPGLVDADFANATPQTINGSLVEVRFLTLGGCQTDLVLENATLIIRDKAGGAAPLVGIALGGNNLTLNIEKELGASHLTDPGTSQPGDREFPSWLLVVFSLLAVAICVLIAINLLRRPTIN